MTIKHNIAQSISIFRFERLVSRALIERKNSIVIKYSEKYKEYFTKDNSKVVNASFMMAMFYFLEAYLKWLIFNCKYDPHDKNQKGLVEMLSKYCGISKSRLIELIEEKKYSENQVKNYLQLSQNLFHGIQTHSSIKYSKELLLLLKSESK